MNNLWKRVKNLLSGNKKASWISEAEQKRQTQQSAANSRRKSGRKRPSLQDRAKEIEALLKDICRTYDGAGKCHVQSQVAKGGRLENVIVVHFIITQKPFRQLNGKAVLDSICSFSVTVSPRDYGLYKIWYDHLDPEAENWRTRLLSTAKLNELKKHIADEWAKGEAGEFFH